MDTIDLRSDTVSWPTPAMREAMAKAIVGDDVYGEDPTVQQLEAESAALLGKEAGLFVTSGTQGNLISILTHCDTRGSEIIVGDRAHTFVYEAGGVSVLGGIHPHTVPVQPDGTMDLDRIHKAIRGPNYHFPTTRLISLENTQGTLGGIPISKEYSDQVAEIAHENGLVLHIDGARFFNAATALELSAKDLAETADSVTFCLSKGLSAPAGSMIVGSQAFIDKARRTRKVLGGGMRQAGILAAAGLIALREMTTRLHEDHANACLLGEKLQQINHVRVKSVHTNFVFFELNEDAPVTPAEFMTRMKEDYNVVLSPYPGYTHTFRAVMHYWISAERVHLVARAMRELLN